MTAITTKAFRGVIPRLSDRLLKPNQAIVADNCKLTSGRLESLKGLQLSHTSLLSGIKTAYRYRVVGDTGPIDNWLVWSSDVNVVPSLVANDSLGRFYFTSDEFEPRISTFTLATSSLPYPTAWYALGVAAPSTAATVTAVGGSGTSESRAYAYTYVTMMGEESPPSPPSDVVTGYPNATWTVASMQVAPPNTGTVVDAQSVVGERVEVELNTTFGFAQYDMITFASVGGMTDLNGTFRIVVIDHGTNTVTVSLNTAQTYTSGGSWAKAAPHNTSGMVKRIYRTTGTGGDFLFVAEVAVSTTSYVDAVSADDLGEILPTADSLLPPKNMVSLVSLPNGCLVGLAGNEICFSDPYMPYSWPLRNRYTFSGRGVALAAAGNSVIVLTDTFPILFTGSDPEAMSPSTMSTYAPCVSKRGVVDVGGGCMYPSYDGLWIAAPGRVEKLTAALYREEEWKKLNPESFIAAFSDGQYYGHYNAGDSSYIWVFDTAEADSATRVEQLADTLVRNDFDGELYVGIDTKLYVWDTNDGTRYTSDWRSGTIQLPTPTNFSVAQVHAQFSDIVPPDTSILEANEDIIDEVDLVGGAINANELLVLEVNASALQQYEATTTRRVQFTLYADGQPVYSREITSSQPFRLPAGFVSEVYNIGLSATVPVYSATIAQSVAELAQNSA